MNENIIEYFNEKYKFIKILNKNEKSEIYLVEGIEDKKLYIKKIIKGANEVYPLLKDIRSEFITKVVFTAKSENELWVVEEYIEGETLRQILEREKVLSQKTVIDIIIKLCGALEVLHSNTIIHRDIKPSNIIVDNDFNVKLIDFDAARCIKNGNLKDTVYLGTQGYAAPEQYGFSQTDYRADIYSIGVLMKEMLGWDNYNGCLKKVILKCMKVDPLQRYQNVCELKRAIKFSIKKKFIKAFIFGIIFLAVLAVAFFTVYSGLSIDIKLNYDNNEAATTELTTQTETMTEELTETTTLETTEIISTETTEITETQTQAVKITENSNSTGIQNDNSDVNKNNIINDQSNQDINGNDRLIRRGENYINNGITLKKLTCIEMEPNRSHSFQIILDKEEYYTVKDYTIDKNNQLWVCVITGNLFMSEGWVCVDDPINIRY